MCSSLFNMGTESNKDERNTPEYLAQLLKDKKQMQAFPNVFLHIERLLDDGKLWSKFFVRNWVSVVVLRHSLNPFLISV